jgi:23S rRNA (pseudouridine1915-N3)-methyltransferase
VNVVIGVVGRAKDAELVELEADYLKRLKAFCTPSVVESKDEASLLARLPKGARIYAFDERGEVMTSAAFAGVIAHEAQHGGGAPLAFLVGGADGHSDELRKRATKLIAFGKLTIAHRLVRVLVLEQIYRAFTIMKGLPYHRE